MSNGNAERIAGEFFEAYFTDEVRATLQMKSWDELPADERNRWIETARTLLRKRIIDEGAVLILDDMYGHTTNREAGKGLGRR